MSHEDPGRRKLLSRVRRIRGQAEALEKLIAQDPGHAAVLQQIAAIRGAVNGLLASVLEEKLHEHEHSQIEANQHHAEHRQLVDLLKACLK